MHVQAFHVKNILPAIVSPLLAEIVLSLSWTCSDAWKNIEDKIHDTYSNIEDTIHDKHSKIKINNVQFSNKMFVWTGIHKMLVRIANSEDPDQTASTEAVWSGYALFV